MQYTVPRLYRTGRPEGSDCWVARDWANLCARDPLEVKIGIGVVGGVADKEAETVDAKEVISRPQCFVALCLSSLLFTQRMRLFFLYPQASDVGGRHRFTRTTVPAVTARRLLRTGG
jgi:hypothetical protein